MSFERRGIYDSVYFIQPKNNRTVVKIGKAVSIAKRLQNLQSAHYEELELICEIRECGYSLEKYLHEIFSDYRIRGEWFKSEILNDTLFIKKKVKHFLMKDCGKAINIWEFLTFHGDLLEKYTKQITTENIILRKKLLKCA